jgi:hypothetical protein
MNALATFERSALPVELSKLQLATGFARASKGTGGVGVGTAIEIQADNYWLGAAGVDWHEPSKLDGSAPITTKASLAFWERKWDAIEN